MTLFATLALVVVLVVRPQEIWPVLESLRLLNVLTALSLLGVVIDYSRGKLGSLYTPQLPFALGFVLTCFVVTVLALGLGIAWGTVTNTVVIPAIFMIVVMYGATTTEGLRAALWTLVLLCAFVSAVAVHQGLQPPVCMQNAEDESGERHPDPTTADGRVCGIKSDCSEHGEWSDDWVCERVGLFGTFSTGRRVRYRGQLGDPNELSVYIGAAIPLLLGLGGRSRPGEGASASKPKRSTSVVLGSILLVVVGLVAVIMSQSRGGQLVVGTVFLVLFLSRFGAKGLVPAALLAMPVLLLGGRDDADAEGSSEERTAVLLDGVSMVIGRPLRGVGVDQFADNLSGVHLTAHNSYLLAAAETGLFGFFLWTGMFWASLKIALTVWKRASLPQEIRALGQALFVSYVGLAVGIFFLSFTYKQLLFVWFGLAGSLYLLARRTDPALRVTVGFRDALGLVTFDLGILTAIWTYTRTHGH